MLADSPRTQSWRLVLVLLSLLLPSQRSLLCGGCRSCTGGRWKEWCCSARRIEKGGFVRGGFQEATIPWLLLVPPTTKHAPTLASSPLAMLMQLLFEAW